MRVTGPVGVPDTLLGVTVAVNFAGWPTVLGFDDEDSAVLVAAGSECVRRASLIRTYSAAAAMAAGSGAGTWGTGAGAGTWGGAATFCRAATIASVMMAVARALCSSLSDAALGVREACFAMFALSKN
jgi:hypothetical protein